MEEMCDGSSFDRVRNELPRGRRSGDIDTENLRSRDYLEVHVT